MSLFFFCKDIQQKQIETNYLLISKNKSKRRVKFSLTILLAVKNEKICY